MSMDEQKEPLMVFEPESIPRQRKAVKPRRASAKCCFIVVIALVCIGFTCIAALIAKTLIYDIDQFTSPHTQNAHRPGKDDKEGKDKALVKPLINSTSSFDIRATVWLDVTEHLGQGKAIPSDIQVLHYKQPGGSDRSDAVIYSDLLFKNVNMDSKLHSTIPIRVPVDPFYSQYLGPATLRATFQIVPHFESPPGLRFNSSVSIYPTGLPIGPRSPQSTLTQGAAGDIEANPIKTRATTLEEALEYSAINVNLLSLLPTAWRIDGSNSTLRSDWGLDGPMYDGSPSNRRFQKANITRTSSLINDTSSFYINSNHRIMLPHVRTRSRITLVREESNFVESFYRKEMELASKFLERNCASLLTISNKVNDTLTETKSDCQRLLTYSIYENLLLFTKEGEGEGAISDELKSNSTTSQAMYAPFLTQRSSSSAHRHHRAIPRFQPGKTADVNTSGSSSSATAKDICTIPILETDYSQQYFTFDWDVAFSSSRHLRATQAEDMYIHVSSTPKEFKDNGTDIRIKYQSQEVINWNLFGVGFADREHAKSKPWTNFSHFLLQLIAPGIVSLLEALYWYTRTTTQGISPRSQMLSLAAGGFSLLSAILESPLYQGDWISVEAFISILSMIVTIVLGILELTVYLHVEVDQDWKVSRRPVNKKERDTRRLDDRIGWLVPGLLFAIHLGFFRYLAPRNLPVISAVGCHLDPANDSSSDLTRILQVAAIASQIGFALGNSSVMMQMIHNAKARTIAGQFKIHAFFDNATVALDMAVSRLEFIGGWQSSRPPITLNNLIALVVTTLQTFQAIAYSGISQEVVESDEDDESFM